MRSFEDLADLVEGWAEDRDLIAYKNAKKQYGKFIEEALELGEAMTMVKAIMNEYVLYGRFKPGANNLVEAEVKMEMGDVLVTLIILARDLDIDILECLDMAYDKISKRTGETIDGVFVKSEDMELRQ